MLVHVGLTVSGWSTSELSWCNGHYMPTEHTVGGNTVYSKGTAYVYWKSAGSYSGWLCENDLDPTT
jgi:hypothetical protein